MSECLIVATGNEWTAAYDSWHPYLPWPPEGATSVNNTVVVWSPSSTSSNNTTYRGAVRGEGKP